MKKFKFNIANNSKYSFNIADHTKSPVRLLVAYPDGFRPQVTVPITKGDDSYGAVFNPPDVSVWKATSWTEAPVSKIEDSEDLFAVPKEFDVWAIPATPNYTVESVGARATYATVIDDEILDPGESYGSDELGHGAWVFNVPLPKELAVFFPEGSPLEVVVGRAQIARSVRVLGVAAFGSGGASPSLLSFAPAPPDSALLPPSRL